MWSGLLPRPMLTLYIDVSNGLHRDIVLSLATAFLFFHCNNELCWTVLDKTSVALFYFQNWFVIILNFCCKTLWCMTCVLLYSLDSPSCEVCLFDPSFCGFNREFTWGTAEVRASWIRVAFTMMVSALIQFILGGSATACIRAKKAIYQRLWQDFLTRNP